MSFGVDANAMKQFFESLLEDEISDSTRLINYALDTSSISVDDKEFVIQEWKDCVGGFCKEYVAEWISEELRKNRLLVSQNKFCNATRKKMVQDGVPHKDAKLIAFYKAVPVRYIISEDIDFFEPTEKSTATPARRKRLMDDRKGSICKIMSKRYKIDLHTTRSFCSQHLQNC